MPQTLRGPLYAFRKRLMYFIVDPNFGRLALGLLAWSSTSAITTVQPAHARRATLVNAAAALGFLAVGCVKWLISFHGTISRTPGNALRNSRRFCSYSAGEGSRHCAAPGVALHCVASPRACSKVTSGRTPACSAAPRYARTRPSSSSPEVITL